MKNTKAQCIVCYHIRFRNYFRNQVPLVIDRFRLPAYPVAFREFFENAQEIILRAQSPLLNALFSGREPPTKASTATTAQGTMSSKEVGVEWEWRITPVDCVAGAYTRSVEAILEQCAENARALVPDAIKSMVSQGALTEVDIGSVDDANLWDVVLNLIESMPATTGENGEPALQQLIVPPAIFQKMQAIPMTDVQERRLESIKEQKFSELKSTRTKTTERRLRRK